MTAANTLGTMPSNMAKVEAFFAQVSGQNITWPNERTYLATINIEPYRIKGLDITKGPSSVDWSPPVPLDIVEGIIKRSPNQLENDAAIVVLRRLCARLLRCLQLGNYGTNTLTDIKADAQIAERLFQVDGNVPAACWCAFIADISAIIFQQRGRTEMSGAYLDELLSNSRSLSESAANLCLRFAYKFLRQDNCRPELGDFDRISCLLTYGQSLCEISENNVVLAQMRATHGRVLSNVNQFDAASHHFECAYDYAMIEYDSEIPRDAFKVVVDEVLRTMANENKSGDERVIRFYDKLERTWPLRFNDEDARTTLRLWKTQSPVWTLKNRLRHLERGNRFRAAQNLVKGDFEAVAGLSSDEAMWPLYGTTNLLMNFGLLQFAREITEKLDKFPYNIFELESTDWRSSETNCWIAFISCVERTAFKNSLRYLRRLERIANLSPDPQKHKLDDYERLPHVARAYIYESRWEDAFGLLQCSCSLINSRRESLTDAEVQKDFFGSAVVEAAFDWIVWVCLHFHNAEKPPETGSLRLSTGSKIWAEEALYYADMGKARHIGDVLRKQRLRSIHTASPLPSQQPHSQIGKARLPRIDSRTLQGDPDLLGDLPNWLDPDTLVLHLTLKHEGLGLICLNVSGIHYAKWFPDFGTWNVQTLTSTFYSAIEHPNFRERLETRPETTRKKLEKPIKDLSAMLISPIKHLLGTVSPKRICFVPAGHLSRVPFAALEHNEKPLIEAFSTYQVPSLAILRELSEAARCKSPGYDNISVIARSSHVDQETLAATAVECMDVADQFGLTSHLANAEEMDNQAFLNLYSKSDALYVGTHGNVDYDNPLNWSLSLHEPFRVADLERVESRAKLIFLNACFTALGVSTKTDDMTGFQAKILESGALAFAGSLWNAHALASMFFTHLFCKELLSPQNKGSTLTDVFCIAQRRLLKLDRVGAQEIVDLLHKQWVGHQAAQDIPDGLIKDGSAFFNGCGNKVREDFVSPYFWATFMLVGHGFSV